MVDNLLLPVTIDRVLDSNGKPVPNAEIYVYDALTTDLKNVFLDRELNVPADNPIEADSAGYVNARYIGIGAYKLIIGTNTEDNLPGALDTSGYSNDEATPISPVITKTTNYTVVELDQGKTILGDPTGGAIQFTLPSAVTVGDNWLATFKNIGTANTLTLAASGGQLIDGASELILRYQHEGVTLVSDGAGWHVKESSRLNTPTLSIIPQGRLTSVSGTPILAADSASSSAVYYTPFNGNLLPFYDGNRYVSEEFAELTLTLVSQHLVNTLYDVFAFKDGTTQRIGTGPAWSNSALDSGDRGTGAATTEIERTGGLYTNKISMTARNGTSTYTVDATKGTYLGTILIDATAGQVTCHLSYGQLRKWSVWNAFNRKPIIMIGGDGTASWTYAVAGVVRPSAANADNKFTVFCGLPEENIEATFAQVIGGTSAGAIGVGLNSTVAFVANCVYGQHIEDAAGDAKKLVRSGYDLPPRIGANELTMLEVVTSGTLQLRGTTQNMLFRARWEG